MDWHKHRDNGTHFVRKVTETELVIFIGARLQLRFDTDQYADIDKGKGKGGPYSEGA